MDSLCLSVLVLVCMKPQVSDRSTAAGATPTYSQPDGTDAARPGATLSASGHAPSPEAIDILTPCQLERTTAQQHTPDTQVRGMCSQHEGQQACAVVWCEHACVSASQQGADCTGTAGV